MSLSDRIDWGKTGGLVPAIVQDSASGEVRMLGFMDRAALEETNRTGFVTFFSRSRGKLWRKGESSGNVLAVEDIRLDCDADTLLVLATPQGPTCHTGARSCFGDAPSTGTGFLADLAAIVRARAEADPEQSYTARLISAGVKRIAQKVGEEGVEVALAATAGDDAEVTSEAADLVFHLTVLLQASGSSWDAVMAELKRRHRPDPPFVGSSNG